MSASRNLRRASALSARFLIVGAVSTLIEVVAFNLVMLTGVDPVPAKIIASLIALINAYIGNREWAFRSRARTGRRRQAAWFLVVNAACTAIGAGAVWGGERVLDEIFGAVGPFGLNVINLIAIGGVTVIRFALYHHLVFPRVKVTRDGRSSSDRLAG